MIIKVVQQPSSCRSAEEKWIVFTNIFTHIFQIATGKNEKRPDPLTESDLEFLNSYER